MKIFVQNQDGAEFQPSRLLMGSSIGILKYVEDLKEGPNTEFGQKDYFEVACSIAARCRSHLKLERYGKNFQGIELNPIRTINHIPNTIGYCQSPEGE